MRIYKDKTFGMLIAQLFSIAQHQTAKQWNKIFLVRYWLARKLFPVIRVDLGDGHHVLFKALSQLTASRARNMLRKEPATTGWIENFERGAVFWDIGANVGVYSLLAAKKRDACVYAFEPYPPNFGNLIENISLNKLTERINTFCVAFSNKTCIDGFYVNQNWQGAGESGNSFGAAVDQKGQAFRAAEKISTLGITIDRFIEIFDAPCPQYLKIDVDGIELDILRGAEETLSNPMLLSVVVELEGSRTAETETAVSLMAKYGFRVDGEHRTTTNTDNLSTNYHFVRA